MKRLMLILAIVAFLVGGYLGIQGKLYTVLKKVDDLGLTPRVMDKAWLEEIERLSKEKKDV